MSNPALSEHTLIIPTYNRPAFLARLVTYYTGRTADLPLLVLDSSHPDVAEQNAATLARIAGNVRHATFPSTTPMIQKLAHGLQEVTTSTVSFCADDDVVFPDGLRTALSFLGRHGDFVSAHGFYLNFRQDGRMIDLSFEYSGPSNNAAHPLARVYALMTRYESLFYGMYRTERLRDIVQRAAELSSLHYQELFQSAASLIDGKVQRLPVIYAARQSCSPAEPERTNWQTHYWFAENPRECIAEYQVYVGRLWDYYRTRAGAELSEADFVRIMDVIHAAYFAKEFDPEYYWSQLARFWPQDRSKYAVTKARWRMSDDRELTGVLLKDAPIMSAARPALALRKWFPRAAETAANAIGAAHRAWPQLSQARRRSANDDWQYRLPVELHWLPAAPQFETAWHELRRFLDRGGAQLP